MPRKMYIQKFRAVWLSDDCIKGWLFEDKGEKGHSYCVLAANGEDYYVFFISIVYCLDHCVIEVFFRQNWVGAWSVQAFSCSHRGRVAGCFPCETSSINTRKYCYLMKGIRINFLEVFCCFYFSVNKLENLYSFMFFYIFPDGDSKIIFVYKNLFELLDYSPQGSDSS